MKNSTRNSTRSTERLSRPAMLMGTALLLSGRSTCLRLQVGALVELAGRILVTGYNGAPSGMPHCTSDICGPKKPCTRTIHAEANCIAFAARMGVAIVGAVLYTTDSPCADCAKLIINSGIVKVVYKRAYRDPAPLQLLESAGIFVEQYDAG